MPSDFSISIKLISPHQIDVVIEMMKKFYSIDQYPFYENKTRENLKNFIHNPELGRLWLIYADEIIIGYVVLTFGFSFEYGGRDAFIDELFIEAEFRGKGIGKTVIDFITVEAKKLEVQSIHLEVENHNERGNALYLKSRFEGKNRQLLTKKIF